MFVYGVTTVGATVHVHYCMGKFIGWEISQPITSNCNKCGMKESTTKKGCCKDEVKQLKVDTDQLKSTAVSFTKNTSAPPLFILPELNTFSINMFRGSPKNVFYSPPIIPPIQKLQVLYCTYRI